VRMVWSGREGNVSRSRQERDSEEEKLDQATCIDILYSLLRYGQTVYTGGAAHSRPQAEAEEMKKDLETDISFNS
jgi:hypothetical protein